MESDTVYIVLYDTIRIVSDIDTRIGVLVVLCDARNRVAVSDTPYSGLLDMEGFSQNETLLVRVLTSFLQSTLTELETARIFSFFASISLDQTQYSHLVSSGFGKILKIAKTGFLPSLFWS